VPTGWFGCIESLGGQPNRAHKGPPGATRKTDYDIVYLGEKMKTGQDVIETGLYASDCCGEEVMLEEDSTFPRCTKCQRLATWEVVDIPIEKAA
jgi:hypothetical protein